jgi:hypothetical protein
MAAPKSATLTPSRDLLERFAKPTVKATSTTAPLRSYFRDFGF